MDWIHLFHGLQLNDNSPFYQQVQPVCGIQFHRLIRDWQVLLTFDCQSTLEELVRQASFIRCFEETWSQGSMDFNRRSNDLPGNLV